MRIDTLVSRLLLALAILIAPGVSARSASPIIFGFYESWAERETSAPEATTLANLPPHLDIVAVAFARPDLVYETGDDLSGTGLEVPFGADMLRRSVAAYKRRNSQARVILSIGGATYTGWEAYAADAVARLVAAVGFDGIDLDYEPERPGCRRQSARTQIVCAGDAEWNRIVLQTRARLPRPALLTVQGWSVGAYGARAFEHDGPTAPHTGSMLWLERDPAAREIDMVSIMAYGAGSRFDPLRAFAAYRAVWPGVLVLGIEARPEAGEPGPSEATLRHYADAVRREPPSGLMLYTVTAAPATSAILCSALGRQDCDGPSR